MPNRRLPSEDNAAPAGAKARPILHVVGDSISMHCGPDLERMLAGVAAYSRKPTLPNDPESANGRDSDTVLAYLRSSTTAETHCLETPSTTP